MRSIVVTLYLYEDTCCRYLRHEVNISRHCIPLRRYIQKIYDMMSISRDTVPLRRYFPDIYNCWGYFFGGQCIPSLSQQILSQNVFLVRVYIIQTLPIKGQRHEFNNRMWSKA